MPLLTLMIIRRHSEIAGIKASVIYENKKREVQILGHDFVHSTYNVSLKGNFYV